MQSNYGLESADTPTESGGSVLGITLPGSPLASLTAPQGHQAGEEDREQEGAGRAAAGGGGGGGFRNGGNSRGGVTRGGGVKDKVQRGWWCGVQRVWGCSVASAVVGVGSLSAPCLEELEHQKVLASEVHGRHTFSKVLSMKTLYSKCTRALTFENFCPKKKSGVDGQFSSEEEGSLGGRRSPLLVLGGRRNPLLVAQGSAQGTNSQKYSRYVDCTQYIHEATDFLRISGAAPGGTRLCTGHSEEQELPVYGHLGP
jgi:hypothetical protein